MDWVKLATRYYTDPKIRALDDAAELMFVRGLARAGELGDGGFIPESDLGLLARRRRYETVVKALVDARLWSRVNGGYRIAAWADWQSAADALAARRTADRERQRKRRASVSRDNGILSRDVTPTEGEGEKEPRGVVQRVTGGDPHARPPPKTCAKHPDGTDDPCRRCQSARHAHEAWQADKRTRQANAPRCPNPNHPGQPADNCGGCAADRKAAA